MGEMQHRMLDDMLVHVKDLDDQQNDTYNVQITLEGERHFDGLLDLGGLQPPPAGSARALALYGIELFDRLFARPLDDIFQQAWAAAQARNRGLRLRLWLDSSNPALHEIPWELLHYDASGGRARPMPLAVDQGIAFSRFLTSDKPWGEPIEYRPLKLFIMVSAPADLQEAWPDLMPIDKEAEIRALETPLNVMRQAGHITFEHLLSSGTEEDLHAALEQDYDVLLYFGHALHHPDFGTRLVLEDAQTGEADLYDGGELVRRLRQLQRPPSLLILVACNTAAQLNTAPDAVRTSAPTSLAAQLVQEGGVPAVLAMQHLVDIELARTFTHHLSAYLVRHGVIDVAVNAVRNQVYESDSISWGTPVLYMRSRDGRLFAPNARLEYVQNIYNDNRFSRWQEPEFIRLEAITVPEEQTWEVFKFRPQDAPPSSDVLVALRRALQLDSDQSQSGLVVLLGPPRSGQTAILQRLAWDIADETRLNPASARAVAIYVSLAGYEQQRGGGRLEQVIIQSVHGAVPELAEELRLLFRQGSSEDNTPRYIFLLDGLDNVPEGHRAEASAEIVELFHRLPEQSIVVSCVQDVFPTSMFRKATVVLLQPLSERLILRYLRQRAPERSALLFRRIVENRLIDVATDPTMLTWIYDHLARDQAATLTRNQILQELLDRALGQFSARYHQGDAAHRSIFALAWEFRWRQADTLPIRDVFASMAEVRQDRDYSLEDLYETFNETWLLAEVGQDAVRFVHPILQSYCAAIALYNRPDFSARLDDIIAMCGITERMEWWEDTIYALAGMLDIADPLEPLSLAAIRDQSSNHTLIVARSLKALSESAQRHMPNRIRQQLLDICVLRLRANLEPAAERRAQIASALGSLYYARVIDELYQLLARRIRPTPDGMRYDLSNVRLAAARALRIQLTRAGLVTDREERPEPYTEAQWPALPAEDPAQTAAEEGEAAPLMNQIAPDLQALFRAWVAGADGRLSAQERVRAELRAAITREESTLLQQVVAAFALGDLAYHVEDAELLLHMMLRPSPAPMAEHQHEWSEVIWAAAEALALFDAELVSALLVRFFDEGKHTSIPEHSIEQMIHVIGRVRVQDERILRWLHDVLMDAPNHYVKGRALQSLAWLGKAQQSREWLYRLVQSLKWLKEEDPVTPLIEQVMQAIAAWDMRILSMLEEKGVGQFQLADEPDEEQEKATLYLRLKAVEALALVGNARTLERLYPLVPTWPLLLRGTWYLSSRTIRMRYNIPL